MRYRLPPWLAYPLALVVMLVPVAVAAAGCTTSGHHVPVAHASSAVRAAAHTRSAHQARAIFAGCEHKHGFTTRADRKALERCAVPPGHGRQFARCMIGAVIKVMHAGFGSRQARESQFVRLGEACAVANR